MLCASITRACSHMEGSGPHYTLAGCRGTRLLGLAGAVCTGCPKPAVQINPETLKAVKGIEGLHTGCGFSGRFESKQAHTLEGIAVQGSRQLVASGTEGGPTQERDYGADHRRRQIMPLTCTCFVPPPDRTAQSLSQGLLLFRSGHISVLPA